MLFLADRGLTPTPPPYLTLPLRIKVLMTCSLIEPVTKVIFSGPTTKTLTLPRIVVQLLCLDFVLHKTI